MHKKIINLFLIIILLFTLTSCKQTIPKTEIEKEKETEIENLQPSSSVINLMAINDTHGALYTNSDNMGFEKVNNLIKSLEKDNEYIKIANGDIFQGSYISNINYGRPLVEVLNLMKFDAVVIGNHEFDWGIEEIAKYADNNSDNGEANFPFLASNIIDNNTGKTLPWTKEYTIVERDGYKVGIIGAIGAGLESSIAADMIEGYSFVDPLPIIKRLSSELRTNLQCDLVIVAIHEYSTTTNYQIANLKNDSRVDAIICGHTHEKIKEEIIRNDDYSIPVIQSLTKNNSVGTITFNFDNKKLDNATSKHYSPSSYQDDEEVLTFFNNYKEQIEAGERVIAYTPQYLSRNDIGQEMTTAMMEAYDVDVAIINTAGVRGDIKTGDIKVRNVYDVFPFNNKIVLTTLNGSDIKRLYSEHGQYLYFNSDFYSHNIEYNQTYTIATIDFVYTNPYYYSIFTNDITNELNTLMRDVFINYLEN